MENKNAFKTWWLIVALIFLTYACVPAPVEVFDNVEPAIYVERSQLVNAPAPDSSVLVMTWNIRFGIGRGPWFGDACGYKVVYSETEVLTNLQRIADKINTLMPDIVLLQEVDIQSTRSAYVDQLQWLLDHTDYNYAVYGSQWHTQFIPSDGLGRMNETNVILSRWPLDEAKRIQLDLRTDQFFVERYLYERCCMVEAKVIIPGFQDFYVVNTHTSAFAQDSTRVKHLTSFRKRLQEIDAAGYVFVAGGDMNSVPPGSDSTDFCEEHKCEGEIVHQAGVEPYHKEGMYYEPETDGMRELYNAFDNVIPLDEYLQHDSWYFTQNPVPDGAWDRMLDYMFSNHRWKAGSGRVYQECTIESDHVPVCGVLMLRKTL